MSSVALRVDLDDGWPDLFIFSQGIRKSSSRRPSEALREGMMQRGPPVRQQIRSKRPSHNGPNEPSWRPIFSNPLDDHPSREQTKHTTLKPIDGQSTGATLRDAGAHWPMVAKAHGATAAHKYR